MLAKCNKKIIHLHLKLNFGSGQFNPGNIDDMERLNLYAAFQGFSKNVHLPTEVVLSRTPRVAVVPGRRCKMSIY